MPDAGGAGAAHREAKPVGMRPIRFAVQALALLFAVYLAANGAYLAAMADQTREPAGLLSAVAERGLFLFDGSAGSLTIEDYCPLGPVEGAVRFFKSTVLGDGQSFVGPVTMRNLGMLLAVLLLVLVTKKSFCSWLCPFGAVFEFIGEGAARLGVPKVRVSRRADRVLSYGRYLTLALIVALTAISGTLIFKEVDPFFAFFSLGTEVRPVAAYVLLGALAAGAVFIPGVWCRYLCPFSAVMSPLSRVGLIRLVRTSSCTMCGACRRACPQRIEVHRKDRITDADCTNCLNCVSACAQDGAVELRLELKP